MARKAISAQVEVAAVQEALSGTSAGLSAMRGRVLSAAGKGTRQKVNQAIRATTKRRTGELLKAYRYRVKKDAGQVNIYPRKATKASQVFPKAYTLNYGLEGTAHVPRGFVERGEAYAENGEYMAEAEKLVQKELDKYWK